MSTINNDMSIYESLGLTQQPQQQRTDELGQQEFLELMIAQIKNQDPLQPMENGDFIAQLAQFSTASGITELQSSASQFINSLQSSQALQASTLIGRSVLVPSQIGVLPEGGTVEGRVELPVGVQELHVGIFDINGELVRKVNLGSQAAGMVSFEWDGLNGEGEALPAGEYQLRAEAIVGGEAYAVDTLVVANVDSVTLGRNGQSPTLNLAGIGSVGVGEIRQVL